MTIKCKLSYQLPAPLQTLTAETVTFMYASHRSDWGNWHCKAHVTNLSIWPNALQIWPNALHIFPIALRIFPIGQMCSAFGQLHCTFAQMRCAFVQMRCAFGQPYLQWPNAKYGKLCCAFGQIYSKLNYMCNALCS